ncbi:MAG: hypothetical protein IJD80_03005 [Oscillospiraceae bacterium]|nr:hypothetical protein [Oscillospiraceae bacterium]
MIAQTTNFAPSKDGNALFTFAADAIPQFTFSQAGEYLFIIKEAAGTNPIMTYDGTEYNVKVVVAEQDNPATAKQVELAKTVYLVKADGTTVEITDTAVQKDLIGFTNVYNDRTVEVDILKEMVIKGDFNHKVEGFTFVIEDENGRTVAQLTSDENGETGYTFEYDEEDIGNTYTYKVYEKAGHKRHMKYDDTVYTVTVKLTVVDGQLNADVEIMEDGDEYTPSTLVFTNVYSKEKTYVPDTGDSTNTTKWLSLTAASSILLAILLVIRKKMSDEE